MPPWKVLGFDPIFCLRTFHEGRYLWFGGLVVFSHGFLKWLSWCTMKKTENILVPSHHFLPATVGVFNSKYILRSIII